MVVNKLGQFLHLDGIDLMHMVDRVELIITTQVEEVLVFKETFS